MSTFLKSVLGHLSGSVGRAYDLIPQGHEFEPSVGYGSYLNKTLKRYVVYTCGNLLKFSAPWKAHFGVSWPGWDTDTDHCLNVEFTVLWLWKCTPTPSAGTGEAFGCRGTGLARSSGSGKKLHAYL